MLVGRAIFLCLLALVASGIIAISWRRDRVLAVLVSVSMILYIVGGVAFGWYLSNVHGRNYFAPDEQAFQLDAMRIVESWRTGHAYVSVIAGGWPDVNAAVIALWGPSLTPMRLLNAVAAAATVLAVYLLAAATFGRRVDIARTAACLVLLSPSLCIFSFTNLKERMLGLFVVLSLTAAVALIRRWRWTVWAALLVSIFLLGEIRHYYAAMIGWLSVAAFMVLNPTPWWLRIRYTAVLVVSVGVVLLAVTGTFLGTSMLEETIVRYVPLEATPDGTSPDEATGYSGMGQTTGRAELVRIQNLGDLLRHLRFVLVGRFASRGGAGRLLALVMSPEWLVNFALLPLALWALILGIRGPDRLLVVSCAFVGGMMLLLAVTHGDDWSTFRFRTIYWPTYLMIAAAGAVDTYRRLPLFRRHTWHQESIG